VARALDKLDNFEILSEAFPEDEQADSLLAYFKATYVHRRSCGQKAQA